MGMLLSVINLNKHLPIFDASEIYLLAVCLKDYVGSEESNGSSALPNSSDLVFTHSTELEVIWTLVPAFVLMIIAVPSFALLYSLEESVAPEMTLKVVGRQWYWSYEYPEIATKVDVVETPAFD